MKKCCFDGATKTTTLVARGSTPHFGWRERKGLMMDKLIVVLFSPCIAWYCVHDPQFIMDQQYRFFSRFFLALPPFH